MAGFIRVGFYPGLRSGEILALEWSRVDLSRNLIYLGLQNQKGKSGSWLAQTGVPIQAISALLWHSDIRVTDRAYLHLSPASLRGRRGAG